MHRAGPPLASPSCSGPTPSSRELTVGTADSNGRAAEFIGVLRAVAIVGDPATPADEADLLLRATVGDVLTSPGLADYTGELQASVSMRITDRFNGSTQAESGTVQDTPFRFAVPCAATPSDPAGSSCSLITSAEAVVPGSVVEGKRAIWALGPAQLFDGGADGIAATSPNTLFATQGIFVP